MALSESKLFKWYEPLPPYVKAIVIVGGLTVVTIASFTIYNNIKKAVTPDNNLADQQEENQVNDDIQKNINKGAQPTFSDTQYHNFADQIASAFSGCDWTSPVLSSNVVGWSDSAVTVNNIIKQFNNDLDFLGLQKAFGVRTISKSWVCGGDYTNVNLSKAVISQLNTTEIQGINNNLSARNISYRF